MEKSEGWRSQTSAGKQDTRQDDLLEGGGAFGSAGPKFRTQLEVRKAGRFENEEWGPVGKMWLPK